MKLNRFERLLVNNSVRAIIQRRLEAPRLIAIGGRVDGGVALEIGCGRGVGVETILECFRAVRVCAIDLDDEMVDATRLRSARFSSKVEVKQGDATALTYPAAAFDAVFSFGAIHHVVDWRLSLREISRVLKPGGKFYFEEVRRTALEKPLFKLLFDHPVSDRFEPQEFAVALESVGLRLIAPVGALFSSDYFIGVARKI